MHCKSEKHIQIYLQFTNIEREEKYHMNYVTLSHCDMIHTLEYIPTLSTLWVANNA